MNGKNHAMAYRNFDPERPGYEDPDTALTYVKWAVWLLVCGAIMFGIALAMSGCAETNAVVDAPLYGLTYHDALIMDRCKYSNKADEAKFCASEQLDQVKNYPAYNAEVANTNAAIMWAPGSPFNPAIVHVEP